MTHHERGINTLPIKIGFAVVMVLTFITMANLFGIFSMLSTLQDLNDGELEPQTLGDYDPIETIQVTNSTLNVQTEPYPQHESRSPLARDDITHLRVTRDIGGVNSVNEVLVGQQDYSFTLPENAQRGNYTLSLEARKPADPGLFGHPERTYRQEITFTITANDEVNITSVPYSARYN